MAGRRILVVSPEPIGLVRTGVGIRLTEMARHLHTSHQMTLAAPSIEAGLALPFPTTTHSPPPFEDLLAQADVIVSHGHVSNDILAAEPRVPVIFDLYDPFVVENLAYVEQLGSAVFRFDRLTLERQLERGDFFLCASESQRAFYLGALTILGRVNPGTYGKGRDLRHLIEAVPFGVPDSPPVPRPRALRQRLGVGGEPLVFFGGIYDWYDPITALVALRIAASRIPDIKMVVVRNPRQETTPQTLFGKALAYAKEHGLEGRFLVTDWIPYEERGQALADADLGLIAHRPGIETDLSFRTRILDFLWAGLPVVSTDGGAGAELLTRAEAGRLVPPGNPEEMAAAMIDLLDDAAGRRKAGAAGQEYVLRHHTWAKVLEPLDRWLREPAVDSHKPVPGGQRPMGLWGRLLGR